MARPSRRIEGIWPDQNPALDPLDSANPGVFTLVVLLYFTWLVAATSSEARESSRREIARPFLVVDASPVDL